MNKKRIIKLVIALTTILFISFFLLLKKQNTSAIINNHNSYPKLANYFLDWDVMDSEIPQLAKWDLLVLSPQAEERNPGLLKKLKKFNPNIKILVYQLTQESSPFFYNEEVGTYAKTIYDKINDNDWWLYDVNDDYVSLWPTNRIINISQENSDWVDYLLNFVEVNYFNQHPQYDGIFYDNVWYDISWLPDTKIDLNNDGLPDDVKNSDKSWFNATKTILEKTHQVFPEMIIMGNVNFSFYDNYITGKTYENFGKNQHWSWEELMYNYLNNEFKMQPNIKIINKNTNNLENQTNYQQMRFGLTSTLLGDGYYSYDIGDCCHNSIWWYDEYNIKLGKATSQPEKLYSIIGVQSWKKSNASIGIWKREFENGIVIVNATNYKKTINLDEKYHKIKGIQDPKHNDGSFTNIVTLAGQDGIILLTK